MKVYILDCCNPWLLALSPSLYENFIVAFFRNMQAVPSDFAFCFRQPGKNYHETLKMVSQIMKNAVHEYKIVHYENLTHLQRCTRILCKKNLRTGLVTRVPHTICNAKQNTF